MSLHTLAHHLQRAGRNGDSVLVHMTPDEIQGMQALAMAKGGTLTINPHTGLIEANFISDAWKSIRKVAEPLLPFAAGALLGPAGFGVFNTAAGAGLAVGAATGLATGSLSKGLQAGLGAYGGAGLAQGLAGLAGEAAVPTAQPYVPAESAGSIIGRDPSGLSAQLAPSGGTTLTSGPLQSNWERLAAGASQLKDPGNLKLLYDKMNTAAPYSAVAGLAGLAMSPQQGLKAPKNSPGLIRPYTLTRTPNPITPRGFVWDGPVSTGERDYFNDVWTAGDPYAAPGPEYKRAGGGLVAFGVGGPVEQMSAENAIGGNMMYPQSQLNTPTYSNPLPQRPMPTEVIPQGLNMPVNPYTGEQLFAHGGITDGHLGGYSDGGQLLKGPGDGVSDSIPATIAGKQPARLADNEFVIPARIVSELGNGSTDAGARKLYAMMDRVQNARRKTIGKDNIAVDTHAEKYLPA